MKLFYEMHPQFKYRDIYLAAQDFAAGQYLPVFASALEEVQEGTYYDYSFEE
jgi:hypothetical protein